MAGALAGADADDDRLQGRGDRAESFHMELPLLENRFQFKRALEALR